MLRLSDSVDEQLELVPDESYGWLEATKSILEQRFSHVLSRAQYEFNDIIATVDEDANHKEFATLALKSNLKAVLFVMLDDKPEAQIHELLWKMLEP